MSNAMIGKFWLLDTAGLVTDKSVKIKNIMVTWKVASAGSLELQEYDVDSGPMDTFLYAATLGATSAAGDQLTQVFPIHNVVQGFWIKTIGQVAKLIVNVE